MTVAELIAELQKLPQDALCITAYDYDVKTGRVELGSWSEGRSGGWFVSDRESWMPENHKATAVPAVRIV